MHLAEDAVERMRKWMFNATRARFPTEPGRGKNNSTEQQGPPARFLPAIRAVLSRRFGRGWLALPLLITAVASPAGAAVLVVTTTADVVNGDVSSPEALLANPGPDGVSLREAVTAVNNTPGPHTITFSPALAGQTIVLSGQGFVITRDHIALAGLTMPGGQPAVTLDFRAINPKESPIRLKASDFTLRRLRVISNPTIVGLAHVAAVLARIDAAAQPPQIINVDIEDNVFDNNGEDRPTGAVSIGCEDAFGLTGPAVNGQVRNVRIAGNQFIHFIGDESIVLLQSAGTNCLIQNVTIEGNSFRDSLFPVELAPWGVNNRILSTRILRNTFVDNNQSISMENSGREGTPVSTGNTIADTLILRNVFSRSANLAKPHINIVGALTNATGNAIVNTTIANNVMSGVGGIALVGGQGEGATANRVDGVRIVNNTLVASGLAVLANEDGGTANSVTGVSVVNTIFSDSCDFRGVSAAQVAFSIVPAGCSGFDGVNGNVASDPMFVDPANGDFHLRPGSPAIDAGTSDGAPGDDFECRGRVDDPGTPNTGGGAMPFFDIGAFEFGSAPAACPPPPVAAVLPSSRSVQVGQTATAFAAMINPGPGIGRACAPALLTGLPALFSYQTTDAATNQLTGVANRPTDIPPGRTQSFVFAFTTTGVIGPTDVELSFACEDSAPAAIQLGLNTLLFSAEPGPVPDIVALAATLNSDGIVNVPGAHGTGVFSVATVNLGAGGSITASADTGDVTLPLTISLCQTNPTTGQCVSPIGPTATTQINAGETPTFGIFVTGTGTVVFDPANNRVFARFKDAGSVTRGATSVAVQTQ